MAVEIQNFNPRANFVITGTGASSAAVDLSSAEPGYSSQPTQQPLADYRIYNPNTSDVFIARAFSGTATAGTGGVGDVVVGAGKERVFRFGPGVQSIAARFVTGTATGPVYVAVGDGH